MPKNNLVGQNGQARKNIFIGCICDIVFKQNQASGILTRGIVKDILTNIRYHPRGIKVRLDIPNVEDIYRVGRVQYIIGPSNIKDKKIFTLGFKDKKLVTNIELKEQMNFIKQFDLDIIFKNSDSKLSWLHLDDYSKKTTIFQVMQNYRYLKTKGISILPMYAVFTLSDNAIIRLEYYEGVGREYKLIYDLRRKDLYGVNLGYNKI